MKIKTSLIAALVLVLAIPSVAGDKHKKKQSDRAMIEKMEAVPCGARERGVTGLGSIWASVGVQHVNSDEKLCPQYLIRTDDMEYHIRPKDGKHPVILPVGQEAIFKIKKDTLQSQGARRRPKDARLPGGFDETALSRNPIELPKELTITLRTEHRVRM